MTLPELIVLRHGQTEWNAARRWQGALDSPLTPLGVAQARAMGAMFARLGLGPATHRILTSPQPRAGLTAELIFGAGAVRDTRLREIGVGEWTGWTMAEIAADPRCPAAMDLLTLYGAVPGGEGIARLAERCRAILDDLEGPTVLVTHGITGSVLRLMALGLSSDDLSDVPLAQGIAVRIRDTGEDTLVPTAGDGAVAAWSAPA